MSVGEKVWIGADPGGRGNFGLSILGPDGSTQNCCVDCADEAIDVVKKAVKGQPAGIGVDAPLWGSSGRSSDRQADQWLRKKYRFSGGQVQAANSLRGAALVQGAMFVQRMRERYPGVGVTETHPKAVLKALGLKTWASFAKQFSVTAAIRGRQEHKRDAVVSAVAAREGFEGRWKNDLGRARYPTEQDPSAFWLAPVHYFWPDK